MGVGTTETVDRGGWTCGGRRETIDWERTSLASEGGSRGSGPDAREGGAVGEAGRLAGCCGASHSQLINRAISTLSPLRRLLHLTPYSTPAHAPLQHLLHFNPYSTSTLTPPQPLLPNLNAYSTSTLTPPQPLLYLNPYSTSNLYSTSTLTPPQPYSTSILTSPRPLLHHNPYFSSTLTPP